MKTCTVCGETKQVAEFYVKNGKIMASCKMCDRARVQLSQAKQRKRMGEEAYLAHRAEIVRISRLDPDVHDRTVLYSKARGRALELLRKLYPETFEKLLAEERTNVPQP